MPVRAAQCSIIYIRPLRSITFPLTPPPICPWKKSTFCNYEATGRLHYNRFNIQLRQSVSRTADYIQKKKKMKKTQHGRSTANFKCVIYKQGAHMMYTSLFLRQPLAAIRWSISSLQATTIDSHYLHITTKYSKPPPKRSPCTEINTRHRSLHAQRVATELAKMSKKRQPNMFNIPFVSLHTGFFTSYFSNFSSTLPVFFGTTSWDSNSMTCQPLR